MNSAWFQGVFSNIKFAFRHFINNPTLQGKVEGFIATFNSRRQVALEAVVRSERPNDFVPTTPEEIEGANKLLREVIEELQDSK